MQRYSLKKMYSDRQYSLCTVQCAPWLHLEEVLDRLKAALAAPSAVVSLTEGVCDITFRLMQIMHVDDLTE